MRNLVAMQRMKTKLRCLKLNRLLTVDLRRKRVKKLESQQQNNKKRRKNGLEDWLRRLCQIPSQVRVCQPSPPRFISISQNTSFSNRKQCLHTKPEKIDLLDFFVRKKQSPKRKVKETENCIKSTDCAYASMRQPVRIPRQLAAHLSDVRSIIQSLLCRKSS